MIFFSRCGCCATSSVRVRLHHSTFGRFDRNGWLGWWWWWWWRRWRNDDGSGLVRQSVGRHLKGILDFIFSFYFIHCFQTLVNLIRIFCLSPGSASVFVRSSKCVFSQLSFSLTHPPTVCMRCLCRRLLLGGGRERPQGFLFRNKLHFIDDSF